MDYFQWRVLANLLDTFKDSEVKVTAEAQEDGALPQRQQEVERVWNLIDLPTTYSLKRHISHSRITSP